MEAVRLLRELVDRHPAFAEAVELLGQIYEGQGNRVAAREFYLCAAANPALSYQLRAHFAQRAAAYRT